MLLYRQLDRDRLVEFNVTTGQFRILPRESVRELTPLRPGQYADKVRLSISRAPLSKRFSQDGRQRMLREHDEQMRASSQDGRSARELRDRTKGSPPGSTSRPTVPVSPIQIERRHKLPANPTYASPKPSNAPPARKFMGSVPDGFELAAEDPAHGIRVVIGTDGHHTVFPRGAGESALKRLGRSIGSAIDEIALDQQHWDGRIPLGRIVQEVQREHPGTSTGEVLAAIGHLWRGKHLVAHEHAEPQKLVTGFAFQQHPLCDGRSQALATLWARGKALHHFTPANGMSGRQVVGKLVG